MKKKHDKELATKVELITPDRAMADLARAAEQKSNVRGLNKPLVNMLARSIAVDAWMLNGETIKYNSAGVLVDGQHRLAACVLAKKPFKSLVVRGVDDVSEVDTGVHRKAGQVLMHAGEKYGDQLATAARMMWFHVYAGGFGVMHSFGGKSRKMCSVNDVLKIVEEFPTLRASVARCAPVKKIVSAPLIAFIHHRAQKSYDAEAEVFVDDLMNGTGLSPDNPVHALRERIFGARRTRGERLHDRVVHALTIKAWNAVATGRPMRAMRYLPTEEFPTLIE